MGDAKEPEPAASSEAVGSEERLAGILESVLFAAGEPVSLRRLVEILGGPPAAQVRAALMRLAARYAAPERGIRLEEVAGGYQLRTARENAEWVRALFRDRPRRMGRAALETLAIIAYRQPVTRAEIEAIRGVDAEAVLAGLLQRDLIRVCGRKETVGRPLLYGTTERFLELFGLPDLNALPALREIAEGASGNAAAAEGASAGGETADSAAENSQCGGDRLAAGSRATDPGGEGAGEPAHGDGARGQGGPVS